MSPDLRRFLDRAGARYDVVRHPPAYTAQERAATAHVPGRRMAKVVIVRAGEWFSMVVLPAPGFLNVAALARLTRRRGIRVAAESEFIHLFPDCQPGAMSPFGEFYGMDLFLDRDLAGVGEIVLPAGSHGEGIRMTISEYVRVARPTIAALATLSRAA